MMTSVAPDHHQLSPRMWMIISGVASLLLLLFVRLIHLQLFQGTAFLEQADDNRYFDQRLEAERGVLLDRYGQPLVWNTRSYYQLDQPTALHSPSHVIDRDTALQLMASGSGEVGHTLSRVYRYPRSLAAVLGYVGMVSKEELQADETLHITDQVGKMGLEKRVDALVRGVAGSQVFEINALGKKQRLIAKTEPKPGRTLTTTLDPFLSEVAYQALGDQRGAVVISDASSGAVLAMVSKPSFDASLFTNVPLSDQEKKDKQQRLQAAFNDPQQLFFNRAASGSYPPGSVFKLVTALAGLELGKIDANTSVLDEGILKVGEYEYRNWYFTQYGRTEGQISLVRAIARSNDIYFYKAAEWIGPTDLAAAARQFGFGSKPESGLYAEAAGLVPDPQWKEAVVGERWYLGNTYHLGIGQGDLLVSPLQINQMIQAIGKQGSLCQPHFLTQDELSCHELGLQPDQLELVVQGMLDACSAGGTAFPFFPRNTARRLPGSSVTEDLARGAVACKTGTAEFGGANAQGHRQTHAWFVAMVEPQLSLSAPATVVVEEKPTEGGDNADGLVDKVVNRQQWLADVAQHGFPKRIVMTVLVESDETQPFKEGSREAAPVAKAILEAIEQ